MSTSTSPESFTSLEYLSYLQLVAVLQKHQHMSLDDIVSLSLYTGFTKHQISNAIKDYINGRD